MKIYPKNQDSEKEQAVLKHNDMLVTIDHGMENILAKSDTILKPDIAYIMKMEETNEVEENTTNSNCRRICLYEQRMDKGLFCALGLIICLCIVGMATSIGGAIYLKYRSNREQENRDIVLPAHASLVGNRVQFINLSGQDQGPIDKSDATHIHIRLNITSIPEKEGSDPIITTETLALPDAVDAAIDPFEETVWEEIRKFTGHGMAELKELEKQSKPQEMMTGLLDNTTTDEGMVPPKFASVNKHRVLQEAPSFSDLLTFVRKALRLPTIRLVYDPRQ